MLYKQIIKNNNFGISYLFITPIICICRHNLGNKQFNKLEQPIKTNMKSFS